MFTPLTRKLRVQSVVSWLPATVPRGAETLRRPSDIGL